jgi:uncharacterized protein with HEPN domain
VSSKQLSGKSIETRARDAFISIGRIHKFIAGMDRDAFFSDQKTQSAVERELLTISEACSKISDLESSQDIPDKNRLAARFPKIQWSEIRGIGNILRHDYGRVDPEVTWNTVSGDDLRLLEDSLGTAFPGLRES